jgi:DNA-binding CsgD family transcriptional regulator
MENTEPTRSRQGLPFPLKDTALLWRIPFSSETEPSKVEIALRERTKELNCLYGVSQLAERNPGSIGGLLQELVNFLPYSWQYPDITCVRILYQGKTFKSDRFRVTPWRQAAQIYMYHEAVGEIGVFYLEECPPSDEGPFLKEERALLDAVAEQIGTIAARMSAEQELQETNSQLTLERKALQESNAALKKVLEQIEEEKLKIQRDIKTNMEKILTPILHALAAQLPPLQRKYVEILQVNLEEITSPFIRKLSFTCHSLTPTEIAVCNLIRNGMHTKAIAETRGVSEATINRHREKIRRKFKITNQDVNLATFLQSANWNEQ